MADLSQGTRVNSLSLVRYVMAKIGEQDDHSASRVALAKSTRHGAVPVRRLGCRLPVWGGPADHRGDRALARRGGAPAGTAMGPA